MTQTVEVKIMLINPVEIKESVASDLVFNSLKENCPWVSPWTVQVSKGLTDIVSRLLTEIESVMGSCNPDLAYLRITEEADDDWEGIYHRKLQVYIQTQQPIEARDSALLYAVDRAVGRSLQTCHTCGHDLEQKNLNDESERELFPFLPKPKPNKNRFSPHSSFMNVCMPCALSEWQDKPTSMIERIDFKKDNADVFDFQNDWDNLFSEDMDERASDTSTKIYEDLAISDDLQEIADEEKPACITMYDLEAVAKLEESAKDMPKDHALRIKSLIKRLREGSPDKRLVFVPETWREFCEDLMLKFPNFSEVIVFIRNQSALSNRGDGVLRLPPFLLVGGPGIGKTEFVLTLTAGLNTKLEIIDISSAQTGAALTGSESFWANTRPGILFDTLVHGEVANPIIMLDEIDKARNDEAYKPLAALHTLLEPRQAKIFKDLSVTELLIDASHVIWMATANDITKLEKPIIDRFTLFNIADPSKSQMAAIATNQYQRFLDKNPSGAVFEKTMQPEVLSELCEYHPRKVRKILEQAFGLAAYDDRNFITVEDIRASDSESTNEGKSSMGFLCH